MKVCLINNLSRPYNRGGAETVLEGLRHGFAARGDSVFAISTRPIRKKDRLEEIPGDYYLASLYGDLGKIPYAFRYFYHLWDIFNLFSYFKLRKIINKEKPDLLISNNLKGLGLPIFFLPRSLGIKHIHILHDIQLLHPSGLMFWKKELVLDGGLARIYRFIVKMFANQTAAVISPTTWLINLHKQNGFFKDSKNLVLLNPAAKKALLAGSAPASAEGDFKILFVGHVNEAKGIEILYQAASRLGKEQGGRKIRLTIAGHYADRSIRLESGKGLVVVGPQFYSQPELGRLMQESDCLVFPSLCYENAPMAILEAFLAGLPVIASDIGGIGELVRGRGDLFGPGSVEALQEILGQYIKKPPKRRMVDLKILTPEEYVEKLCAFVG